MSVVVVVVVGGGVWVRMAGWGAALYDDPDWADYPDILQEMQTTVLSNSECNATWSHATLIER